MKKIMLHYTPILVGLLFSLYGYGQCSDIILTADRSTTYSCIIAEEDVVWSNATNVSISGNTVTKLASASNNAWNGAAISINEIYDNYYVSSTISSRSGNRMFGIARPNASSNFNFDYALYTRNGGRIEIWESGSRILRPAPRYNVGDVLKVAIENGTVKYYLNDVVLYTSTVPATSFPMYADCSIQNRNAVVNDLRIGHFTDGNFSIAGSLGTSPSYDWKLGGVSQSAASNYSNTSLNDGNIITCETTPDTDGCDPGVLQTSNRITIKEVSAEDFGDLSIDYASTAEGCKQTLENVLWNGTSDNLTVTNTAITKFQGTNNSWTDAHTYSSVSEVFDGGSFMFIATETAGRQKVLGLSTNNDGADYRTIDYAIHLNNDDIDIYENGTRRVDNASTFAVGDTLKIEINDNEVQFYKNSLLLYRSLVAPTLPLHPDASFRNLNGTVGQTLISNITNGSYSIASSFSLGTTPSYQWKVNGANTGTNSTYVNTNIANDDDILCDITLDYAGCNSPIPTNTVKIKELTTPHNSSSFYVSGNSAVGCKNTTEEIVWGTSRNLTVNQNSIQKSQGAGNQWDASAFSTNSVKNGGYAYTVIDQVSLARVFGLSTNNDGIDIFSIDYGANLAGDNRIDIWENGVKVKDNTYTFSIGDTIKIAVEENEVKYYANSLLIYTSATTPTLPLHVDLSLYTANGELNNNFIVNPNTGEFSALATNLGTPSYQWKVNGVNSGANSSTYSNAAITNNDVVTCTITPSLAGCADITYTSSDVTVGFSDIRNTSNFHIETATTPAACKEAWETIVWESTVNLRESDNGELRKIQGAGNQWDAEAFSYNTVKNGGQAITIVTENNLNRAFGLSSTNTGASRDNIQFAIRLQDNGFLDIYESGLEKVNNTTTYATGDTLRVTVEQNEVKYYKNSTLLYISTSTPTLPLHVDLSFYNTNGTLNNFYTTNPTVGTFNTITSNMGATPSYQWTLNGANVSTSASYINTNIVKNDVITCKISPDIVGCSDIQYTSNEIKVDILDINATSDIYIETATAVSSCKEAWEKVVWSTTTFLDESTDGTLTKIQGAGNLWDSEAFSYNTVKNGGQAITIATENSRNRAFGLSTTNTGTDRDDIQFAIRLQNNGFLDIYESGLQRVNNVSTYITGDTLKVAVEQNEVRYYKNSELLYISALTPTLPLHVDLSFYEKLGTLKDIYVVNPTIGTFNIITSNTGASPSYQWVLDGASVGANTSSYTNNSILEGDTLICIITPDLGACSDVTYTSNELNVNTLELNNLADIYISSTANEEACKHGKQRVTWAVTTNVDESETGTLTKIQGDAWFTEAYSYESIGNGGYAMTIVDGATFFGRAFGLSSSNDGPGRDDIDFAFHLQNSGDLDIYESGIRRVNNITTYATGDTLIIAVEKNVVKYYKNSDLLRISRIAPTLPLHVDLSFNGTGGSLSDMFIFNSVSSTFNVNEVNLTGTSTYRWTLNGTDVGTNNTYTNTSIETDDNIICYVRPGFDGCQDVEYVTNPVNIEVKDIDATGELYITGTNATGCKETYQQATWTSIDRLEINYETGIISKIQGGNDWNAGASSFGSVKDNGFLQFVATETSTTKAIGLSTTNIDNERNTIQFGFQLQNDGFVDIYESGNRRLNNFDTYVAGDIFKVAVESGVVKYYINGELQYTSTVAPTLPLVADIAFNTQGGTISNVQIINTNAGDHALNFDKVGANPTIQWKLDGVNVGTNSTTYTNDAVADNQVITATIVPNIDGCQDVEYTANGITIDFIDIERFGTFFIENSDVTAACKMAKERITWTDIVLLGNDDDQNLKRIQNKNNWTTGAFGYNSFGEKGYIFTVVNETNERRAFGASASNTGVGRDNMQYAFSINSDATFTIYENGISRSTGTTQTYNTGDTLKILYEDNTIKYFQNSTLIRISGITPSAQLFPHASINSTGGTIANSFVVTPSIGNFSLTSANLGTTPTYQWKLQGANVGTGATTYSNANIASNDVIICTVTPDLPGCTNTEYESEPITIEGVDQPLGDFYVTTTTASPACKEAWEKVSWTDTKSVDFSQGNVLKRENTNAFDAGAFGLNKVTKNGYTFTVVDETNTTRYFGLNNTNPGQTNSEIPFAFSLRNDGFLGIREFGSSKGIVGAYNTGDTLKVRVNDNNVIEYYQNSTLVYTSTLTPTLPLYTDMSIRTNGATLKEIYVSNYTDGNYEVVTTDIGAISSYQWKLNGVNVGAGTTTHSLATLNDRDIITCTIVPNLAGCSDTSFTSTNVVNIDNNDDNVFDFYAYNNVSSSICESAIEDVVWTNLNNLKVDGNTLEKVANDGTFNGAALTLNKVSNNGYFEFTVNETNTNRYIGLSTLNAGLGETGIDYAIDFNDNATFNIRENNANRASGTYANGDVFRIAVEKNVVKYYKNTVLVHTSTVTPTLPLIGDVSFSTIGGSISNAKVAHGTDGVLLASSNAAGNYQWKLNGANVGTNATTYSNFNLADGDIITCDYTPTIVGCEAITSNQVEIDAPINSDLTLTTTTWLGNSTNWFDDNNWSDGIPSSTTTATIAAGTPNNPIVENDAVVYGLTINNGANLEIANSNKIQVYHDWNNQGTLTANTSTVILNTCFDDTIYVDATTSQSFHNLMIENVKHVRITTGNHIVNGSLDLTDGIMYLDAAAKVTLTDDATTSNVSNTSYVDGTVSKIGNDAFIFPIGRNELYRPIEISAPSSITDEFTATYYDEAASAYDLRSVDPTMTHVSWEEYWILDRDNGTSPVNVTLYWDSGSDVSAINDLVVSRWDGTTWKDHGNGGTTGTAASGTIVSSAAITNFSPFTFGTITTANVLPVEFISFDAKLIEDEVQLEWQTASEINNKEFIIERSIDGITWEEIATIEGNGTSNSVNSYQAIDANPIEGTSFYRLQQVDYDGTTDYSSIVDIANIGSLELVVYPNPSEGLFQIEVSGNAENLENIKVYLTDIYGQQALVETQVDGNIISVNATEFTAGIYFVELKTNNDSYIHKIVIEK
ncbi:MAG: T9SS type A sorting domain-containing protein [Cytophagales bacterium]|nr:T9SS type A sorting domain-containing protein [Cytophagales bacterium]